MTDKDTAAGTHAQENLPEIKTPADLREFLGSLRDKMSDQAAAPIYALSAMNYVLNLPEIYTLLDNENKELARDVWLRIKQSGLQIKNPPLLFGEEEAEAGSPAANG